MKKAIIILVAFIPMISFSQYEYGFLQETFFGRLPSARAESLGKSFSSIDNDLACIFFNPAGTATIQGIEINTSYASPLYLLKNAKYNFIAIGYNFNKYLTIGVSRNHFTSGVDYKKTDSIGNVINYGTPTNSVYSLNISSEPVQNLFIGLNSNYLVWKPSYKPTSTSIYFDFGIIKKFLFGRRKATEHSINLGASISNFNFSKIDSEFNGNVTSYSLPVVTRYSTNYQFFFRKKVFNDTVNFIRVLFQGEYQFLLNSDYHSGFHTGAELSVLEVLSFRIGFYQEVVKGDHLPFVLKDEIHSFTYGFGLQLPIYKLTRIPLNISFDYTSLPQVNYLNTLQTLDNFSSYTIRLNILIKNNSPQHRL